MNPKQKELQDRVIAELRFMAGPHAPGIVGKDSSLARDFRLTVAQVSTLAATFEEIAREVQPAARISRDACAALSTVGEAVALVGRAAGFDGTWIEAAA